MKILPISGFPEWSPAQEVVAQTFMERIRETFKAHGFSPLETPAVERVSSLVSKGGGDNEKEIYAITRLQGNSTDDHDLALHFDLTVPMARYVAQHEHSLVFPFARYQMQKVWRGERAQAGRFREFYQCDIDVIGRDSLALDYDAKVVTVMASVLEKLNVGNFCIRVNNRKMLQGFLQSCGVKTEQNRQVMNVIDRLDKIGIAEVVESLKTEVGLSESDSNRLVNYLQRSFSEDDLRNLEDLCKETLFEEGKNELLEMLKAVRLMGVSNSVIVVDPSIARGLDYYTGNVFETRLVDFPQVGSVCSGGRYENLVERFSNRSFPGVGMSIGLTRLLSQLFAYNVVTPKETSFTDVVVFNIDEESFGYRAKLAQKLRARALSVDEYLGRAKLVKQIEYAVKRGVRFGLIAGMTECQKETLIIKDLKEETQQEYQFADIESFVLKLRKGV